MATLAMGLVLGGAALVEPAWAGCFKGRCNAPTTTIAVPAANATYGTAQNIVLSGRATGDYVIDPVGEFHYFNISRVEVYNGATLVGNATLGATGGDDSEREWRDYSYTFAPLAAGTYTLKVKAYDSGGSAEAGFTQVNITVATSNASPTVALASPSGGAVVTANRPVTLTASASDTDGSVAGVQYFDGASAISGVLTAPPYSFSWTPTTLNAHTLKAVATDNAGASTTSVGVDITVNDAPTAALSVSNAANQNPGSITLQATASDSVGGLSTIQYLANGNSVSGIVFGAPYTFTWSGVGPGTYRIVVRVIDVHGVATDSAPYTWVVNAAPSIGIAGPASGTVSAAPGSFSFTANAADSDGAISSVQWYANGSAISGALTSAPYAFTWSGVGAGSYSITARASDNAGGVTTSAAITVVSNDAPLVSLNPSSANGLAPGSVTLQASASDSVGGVSNLQYFANGSAISAPLTAAPYTFNWSSIGAGTYAIVARATDGYGRTADSAAYSLSVNAAPSVAITSPASGSVLLAPGAVTLSVNASDPDGSISSVQYYLNGSALGTPVTTAPFSTTWNAPAPGVYSITARATDNSSAAVTSGAISVTINDRPSISLATSNVANQNPGSITLQATASDAVGGLSTVQYLVNGSLLPGNANAAPYTYNWTGVGPGTYSIVSRATDTYGVVTDSTPYVWVVNAAPSVSIAGPAGGTVSNAPGSFSFTANAADSDGAISSVQWYANGSAISGALTSAPYAFTWSSVAAGSYSITARASDNAGGVTTSAAITVVSNDAPSVSLNPGSANSQAPGSVTLQASASDSVGGVSNLQYFANGSAISAALTAAPYTFNWSSIGAGTYAIVARATDGYGRTADSAGYSLRVNAAPSVAITSPASGSVLLAPGTVTLSVNASDPDGSISAVQYYVNGTALGAPVTTAPFSATWTAPAPGVYSLTARATDNSAAAVTSAAVSVTINDRPSVSLATSSASGQAPGSITLQASASDSQGGVSSVQYFANGSAISGTLNSAPYAFTWGNVGGGNYSLTARATDSYGATGDSAAYAFGVNIAPSVTLVSPANGALVNSGVPATIALAASATDSDGSITKVEYLANGSVVATSTAAPFTANWSAGAGTYMLQARATDNSGGVTTSGLTLLSVDAPPSVAITSPGNGASYRPGWDIPVTVAAQDSDGSLSKVEVYDGATLVATFTGAPYTTTLPDVPAGTHVLTAKAYDNQGAVTTSAAVTVNVAFNAPPASSGSGIVGKLAGSLGVGSGGSAQYTIPVTLPPGTAGMVPAVALKYDSRGGNGVAGVGWSVAGVSQITRCPRDWAHDGMRLGVDLSSNDRFCLDSQRLVAVSGTYGASGTEYRTEIDSFTKVVSVGHPGSSTSYFTATRRDGTVLEYGNTADSRLILNGQTTPLAWSVNKVTDARTNYYTVAYTTIGSTSQQLLDRIDYTGNTAASKPVYNAVRFVYDQTRTDVEARYVLGVKISGTARLAHIQTYAGTTLVKDYRLAYNTSAPTGRSRMQSVTECADAGTTCLPATTFAWEDTPAGTSDATLTFAGGPAEFGSGGDWDMSTDGQDFWVDLNGDGRPDHCNAVVVVRDSGAVLRDQVRCALSQPGSATPKPPDLPFNFAPQSSYSFVDVDGDGVADLCAGECVGYHFAWDSGNEERYPALKVAARDYVDFDGSGKAGACSVTNGGSGSTYRLECGAITPSTQPKAATINYGAVPACIGPTCPALQFSWPDISGDGIPSFCRIDGSVIRCRKLFRTGLGAEVNTGSINLGDEVGRTWADVNGDGKADFCRVVSSAPNQPNVQGTVQCTLATGTGFGDTIVSAQLDVGFTPGVYQDPLTGLYYSTGGRAWVDVNGDGKADYCRVVGGATACVLSTGSGFGGSFTLASAASPQSAKWADASGDGRLDLCGFVAGRGQVCRVAAGTVPDLLLSVTDGLGATASLDYRPISDPGVYTKGSGAVFPTTDQQDSMHVVSRVRADDGVGGRNDTTYRYEGAKVHRQGRGFLGFSATTSTAPNGTVSRVEALTEFPYTGLTRRTQASQGGVTLTDTTVSHAASAVAPYLVVPTLTVTRTNDLNGAFINWTESGTAQADYDAYGNPRKLKTIYKDASGNPDGHGQDSVITYQNDTTRWILGRPTRLAITSHAPGQPDSTRTTSSSYVEANPGLGLLKQSLTEPDNGGLAGVTNLRLATDYTYDDFGNVLTRTVSGANIATRTEATHTYDPQGRGPLTVQNALGHLETRVYDWRHGVASSLQGPNGLFTTWTQDAFGRPLTEDRADGTRTTTSYNPCAACVPGAVYSVNTTHTVIAGGATVAPPTRAYHDSLGRAILSVQPGFDGRYVYRETVYDNLGRVNYTAAAHFADEAVVHWTQFDHDVLGRTVKVTAPDNSLTTTAYNGRTTSTTDANGVTGSSTVNSQGKTISIADAQGTADASSVSYEYDPWGNVSKTTDAAGNVITVTYDLLGRRTRLEDPDLGRWIYTVDNLGQLTGQTDAKGQATAYTYDLLRRMTRRLEPDLDSRWVYDTAAMGVGQLAEAYTLTGGGAKDYRRVHSYDALGRPASAVTTLDRDYASTQAYDAAGRLGSETHEVRAVGAGSGSGHSFSYTYNGQGYLERLSEGATVHWQVLEQDAQGRVTQGRHANGVVTRRSYNPATARLEGIAVLHPATGQASIQNDGYAYDPVGNLRRRTQLSGSGTLQESFGYDSLNRVTSAQVAGQAQKTFGYDSIGNLASKSGVGGYTYPANGAASVRPHAVAGITGSVNGVVNPNFSYDDNGNLLSGAGRSYTWTSYDRPASISLGTGASQATDSFLHGPEHQRIRQTRAKGNPAVTQSTVYYAGAIEREVSAGGGTVIKTYLPQNLGVVQDTQAGSATTTAVRTFHHDHLGSVIALSDEAANVVERLSYDAWGLRRNPDGSDDAGTPPNQIRDGIDNKGYTGHEQLDDVRLVHMNGRVYDPVVGRFTSADPMVSDTTPSQGRNRYSYVLNNPLAFTDPTGLLEDNASATAGTDNSGTKCSAFMGGCTVYEFGSGDAPDEGARGARTFAGIRSNSFLPGLSNEESLQSFTFRSYSFLPKFSDEESLQSFTDVDPMGNPLGSNPLRGGAFAIAGATAAVGVVAVAAPQAGIYVLGKVESFGLRYFTRSVSTEFSADWALARNYLSANELGAGARLTAANYGKAIERAVAEKVANNPVMSRLLDYTSKPFQKVPDFASKYGEKVYDVTTKATKWGSDHLDRGYKGVLELIEYVRPSGFRF